MQDKYAVIIGVGEGLGLALVKKFLAQDFHVIMIARHQNKLDALRAMLGNPSRLFAISADMSEASEIQRAFQIIKEQYQLPEVLLYNASAPFQMKGILDINPAEFTKHWQISCLAGLLVSQEVIPQMLKEKKGTIIFTGATAALRSNAQVASFAVAKFSQRALAQSMAKEFGPQGIHVAHVVIDGFIATPEVLKHYPDRPLETFLNPDKIAEAYWQLYEQDKTVWTHELDIRPFSEKF